MMTTIVKQQSLTSLLQGFVDSSVTLHECQLTDICMDSRRVTAGTLFLALAPHSVERIKHLQQAVEKGVFAVLIDAAKPLTDAEQTLLNENAVSAYPVKDLAQQAGYIAAHFYQQPSQHMTLIAITGTNGKTSVSQFIAQALEAQGKACGVIGTMGAGRLKDLELTGMTTPDPVTMQRLLAGFKLEGCDYVVMEASSHALQQGRLNSVEIDIAVFTNLSRDHLDYHQTMARYADAKMRLFTLPALKHVVVNVDDEFGLRVLNTIANDVKALRYSSTGQAAEIMATEIDCHIDGIDMTLTLNQTDYSLNLLILGRFNVDNVLATIGVMQALAFNPQQILSAIKACRPITGRMEAYGQSGQPRIVIDYAHTPDALEQALTTLRSHLATEAQLWCVFGCGGDRDKGKRPLMGQIAEQQADKVIVTDDNPRTEDHLLIIADILAGCQQPENIHVEHDRRIAIEYAMAHAQTNDIVLVAGKGHEVYQEINHVRYPFSDAHIVTDKLVELENGVYNVAGGH